MKAEKLKFAMDYATVAMLAIVIAGGMLYILGQMASVLSPLTTTLFAIWGTWFAMKCSRSTAILSGAGLLLYFSAWFMPVEMEKIFIAGIASIGIFTWATALGIALVRYFRT